MDISVRLAFNEPAALRLLNWLATENALIIHAYDRAAEREARQAVLGGATPWRTGLPGIYESGVRYEREEGEIWGDVINTIMQGHEDCDALAAWRAGELMARGWMALRPPWWKMDPRSLSPDASVRYPGDEGYDQAIASRPRSIRSEVFVKTTTTPQRPGLYHCIVRYWVGGREYRDDPSARLGMRSGSAEGQQGLAGYPVRVVA